MDSEAELLADKFAREDSRGLLKNHFGHIMDCVLGKIDNRNEPNVPPCENPNHNAHPLQSKCD
jgi:hypothetical protein